MLREFTELVLETIKQDFPDIAISSCSSVGDMCFKCTILVYERNFKYTLVNYRRSAWLQFKKDHAVFYTVPSGDKRGEFEYSNPAFPDNLIEHMRENRV